MHLACSEIDCPDESEARGMCGRHYMRATRQGRLPQDYPRPSNLQRIVSLILIGDGCWEIRKAKGDYGSFGYRTDDGRVISLGFHKAMWMIWNGPVPEGMMVLHTCDNRRCCRPDHLYLGTHQDNMNDRNTRHPHWTKSVSV